MYNINNVTLEEHNCTQLQLYLKLPKYKPFETLNKKGKIWEQWRKEVQ